MNTPVYSQLLRHKQLDFSPFHTPGHKNNFFTENLFELDFTELPGTDALYEADGIILQTEKNLAKLFSAKRSLISSGGCTLAIQTMLKLACQRGKKILFARNIHRSAVNACALLGITPKWILPKSENPLFTGVISPEDVEREFMKDSGISALYVTSPNYYGEITDIKSLSEICRKYNKLLLVDNAHGSHLAFLKENQHPIHLGADMSACSLHKTLPVLTGGAVLNIANPDFIEHAKNAMSLFGSTSPSYPIMASIDLCCKYMSEKGTDEYKLLEQRVLQIKALAKNYGIAQPLSLCDNTRLCISTPNIQNQMEFFHSHKIEPEFCDGKNAVFICTPFNSERDFQRLEKALSEIHGQPEHTAFTFTLPETAFTPREAILAPSEIIPVEKSLNRISADSACPCPPGVPVVMPGEIIDENSISLLGKNTFIRVVKGAF